METMECIYFKRSRCGVPKRDYAPYPVIDERKIDRITPSREKFTLDPSLSAAVYYGSRNGAKFNKLNCC